MFDFPTRSRKRRAALAWPRSPATTRTTTGTRSRPTIAGRSGDEADASRADRSEAPGEKLSKSVERLREILEESRRWLGFRDIQFRAALDCSLRLMDIEGGLTPEPLERPRARRYVFPTDVARAEPLLARDAQ